MPETIDELMNEIRGRIEILEASLPRRVDAMVSPDSKLPFKALIYRTALIWRMAELSRGALENFEKDRLALAILETRAAVETSAALWYLHAKLDDTLQAGADDIINLTRHLLEVDKYLMRLAMGSRTDTDIMPQAISVLTFVDRVQKDVEGFRHQYDRLSEFAHPNWAGTALLYSKPDPPNLWMDFSPNMRGVEGPKQVGVINLSVALMFFERSYNRIADIMPAFIELCKGYPQADESEPPPKEFPLNQESQGE